MHETGLRMLVGLAARTGGILDAGIEPVLAHSTLHYIRVYLRVRRGAARADESLQSLGFVTQCNRCSSKWDGPSPSMRCPTCDARVQSAGPLWTGEIADESVISPSSRFCNNEGWADAEAALSGLKGTDRFPPFCHSLERTCSRLKVASASLEDVLNALKGAGFGCMKQPFESGIKTDASYQNFEQAVRTVSAKSA